MDTLLYLLVCLIAIVVEFGIAFGCSQLARAKGRPPVAWFLWGFFLGPVVLLPLVFMKKKEPESQNELLEIE
jgi:hypothetical protein